MIEALLEQADRLAAGGQTEKARDIYVQICQLAPHQARYWLRLAEWQYELEQFSDGLRALEYALRLEPRIQPHCCWLRQRCSKPVVTPKRRNWLNVFKTWKAETTWPPG